MRRLSASCGARRLEYREYETVRSRRAAVYFGCASVIAACAALGYDALFPFLPDPEAVLTWPSPSPAAGPLLSLPPPKDKAALGPASTSAKWPPDPSSAAVPYYGDTIRLVLPQLQASDDDEPAAEEALQESTADAAQPAVAPKLAEAPRANFTETVGEGAPPTADIKSAATEAGPPVSIERRRYGQHDYYNYLHYHYHRHWRHYRH
jgi:hypothetical protein